MYPYTLKFSAWEKMKEMPEFQAKLEKNPEMQRKVLSRISSTTLSPINYMIYIAIQFAFKLLKFR